MNLSLTPGGVDLLLKSVAGKAQLTFVRLQLGNGADAGSSASALTSPMLSVDISAIKTEDTFLTLTSALSSADVDEGFRCTEIGVWAQGGTGTPVLYAYGYTPEATANYIPTTADRIEETQLDVAVYVGEAADVTVAMPNSQVYATSAELAAMKASTNTTLSQLLAVSHTHGVEYDSETCNLILLRPR